MSYLHGGGTFNTRPDEVWFAEAQANIGIGGERPHGYRGRMYARIIEARKYLGMRHRAPVRKLYRGTITWEEVPFEADDARR